MKNKKWIFALLILFAFTLALTGCDMLRGWLDDDDDDDHKHGKSSSQEYFTVDFVILGGPITPNEQILKRGARVTEPVVKDLSSAIIEVIWHTDQSFMVPYSFSMPVYTNLTLYGKWIDE